MLSTLYMQPFKTQYLPQPYLTQCSSPDVCQLFRREWVRVSLGRGCARPVGEEEPVSVPQGLELPTHQAREGGAQHRTLTME